MNKELIDRIQSGDIEALKDVVIALSSGIKTSTVKNELQDNTDDVLKKTLIQMKEYIESVSDRVQKLESRVTDLEKLFDGIEEVSNDEVEKLESQNTEPEKKKADRPPKQ